MRPGVVSKDSEGKIHCRPIRSKIITLLAEKNELKFAVPGGLIGVGTRACLPRRFALGRELILVCSHRPSAYAWRSACGTSARVQGVASVYLHRD